LAPGSRVLSEEVLTIVRKQSLPNSFMTKAITGTNISESSAMPIVRIAKDWDWPDLLRQPPGGQGIWDGIQEEKLERKFS
jgi:hypothetical protein